MATLTKQKAGDTLSPDIMAHKGYRAEWDKLQEVRAQLTELERQYRDLESQALEDRKCARQDIAAEAVLAGQPLESFDPKLRARKDEIWKQRQVVRRAVGIQERRTAEAQAAASKEIAEAHLPAYRELMQKMASVAAELGRLGDQESAFRDRLTEGHVHFSGWIRPMPIPGFTLADEYSRLNLWLSELAENHGIEPKK